MPDQTLEVMSTSTGVGIALERALLGTLHLLAILTFPSPAVASILQAASCSAPDVQAAIDSAQDGDVVLVPAGSCTWSTWRQGYASVRIVDKSLTVRGAGRLATVIRCDAENTWQGAEEEVCLYTDVPEGKSFRVSGFTFTGVARASGFLKLGGTSKAFRLDHNQLDLGPQAVEFGVRAIQTEGCLNGVIDHNVFDAHYQAMNIKHDTCNGGTLGDGTWRAPLGLGSSSYVFVEDNEFRFPNDDRSHSLVDSQGAGRYVLRHNTAYNTTAINHGTETAGRLRSTRSIEIYDNQFVFEGSCWTVVHMRGGTGVIFGNTATCSTVNGAMITVDNYRSHQPYTPWGQCDTTPKGFCNKWDPACSANSGYCACLLDSQCEALYPGEGVPCFTPIDGIVDSTVIYCRDQIGRSTDGGIGTDQELDPVYEWANTLNGQDGDILSRSDHVLEGRDYHNDTQRPGYAPYTYPHPLVGKTPRSPANLQVR